MSQSNGQSCDRLRINQKKKTPKCRNMLVVKRDKIELLDFTLGRVNYIE